MPTLSADSRVSILEPGRCLAVTAAPRDLSLANSSREMPASSGDNFLSEKKAKQLCHCCLKMKPHNNDVTNCSVIV